LESVIERFGDALITAANASLPKKNLNHFLSHVGKPTSSSFITRYRKAAENG
jgi:hypothetical protein